MIHNDVMLIHLMKDESIIHDLINVIPGAQEWEKKLQSLDLKSWLLNWIGGLHPGRTRFVLFLIWKREELDANAIAKVSSIVMSNTKYPVGKQNAGDFSQIVGTIQEQTRWKDTMATRSWLTFRENSTRSTS